MKISWKIWVTFLLFISSLLLLLVLYLMYEREVLDTTQSKAEKYISHIEKLIQVEHDKLAEASWIYNLNSSNENWDNLQSNLISYTSLIHGIQHNLTSSPSHSFLVSGNKNKVIARKFDIILKHSPSFPYLINSKLSATKHKAFNLLLQTAAELWDSEHHKIQDSSQITKLNSNWSSKIYYEHEKQMAFTYWIQFHDEISSQLKSYIKPYVQLLNENVLLNKFTSYKDFLLSTEYELKLSPAPTQNDEFTQDDENEQGDDDNGMELISKTTNTKEFINQMYDLWYNLKPLYDELHAYVRAELGHVYNLTSASPVDVNEEEQATEILNTMYFGTIPEQFFGFNGIGGNTGWTAINKITKPYSGRLDTNIDEELTKYSTSTLAKMIEDYLILLDFPAMHPSFWSESLFGNSPDDGGDEGRSSSMATHGKNCCNSSTYYESNQLNKLKIAICLKNGVTNEETFKNIIRLMVRVKFQMLQRHKSFWFRRTITNAVQRGFEEAIILAMTRPSQLIKFGLVHADYIDDAPSYLNYLYKEALKDLPIMLQALATFRWSLEFFNGAMMISTASSTGNNNKKMSLSLENYNRRWWMLRQNLIGIKPPESRSTSSTMNPIDFTSILTTNRNPLEDYITIVLKYQIYKSLCIWSNESDGSPEDLQTCDIGRVDNNNSSSNNINTKKSKLISVLELGSSVSWTEILKLMTNQSLLDTDPFLDYFEPLHEYLEDRNERRGLQIGWPRILRSDPLEMLRTNPYS